jgi:predicted DNA-binding ribbon-helix-helix protein
LKQIQHEQRLQNLSSGLRVALQAKLWQKRALLAGLGISVVGLLATIGSRDGLSLFRCRFAGD